MTVYVDSSALVKRYVDEDGASAARGHLADAEWVAGNHTFTETYRALRLVLREEDFAEAAALLEDDWLTVAIVALDDHLCRRAAVLAVATGTRTLDALHLSAAERAGGRSLPFLTYDIRLAGAARALGFPVIGV